MGISSRFRREGAAAPEEQLAALRQEAEVLEQRIQEDEREIKMESMSMSRTPKDNAAIRRRYEATDELKARLEKIKAELKPLET